MTVALGGGALKKLLEAYVVEEGSWKKHAAKLSAGEGAKTCKALAKALGHDIPAEVAEWLDAQGAKGLPELRDAGWMVGLSSKVPGSGEEALAKHALLLLVGLVPFGMDASGDQVFVSLRPHPLDVAEVYHFDHEVGQLDAKAGESIADFLVGTWVDEDHADHQAIAKERKAFAARAKKAHAGEDKHVRPLALWERAQWLFGLLEGEPAFEFPALLAKAAPLSAWNKEKASLAREPQLAVYWMLAHLFFGNDEAGKEAAAAAGRCKGTWIAELAKAFAAYFAGKTKSPVKALPAATIAKLRAVVAKNAGSALTGKKSGGDSEVSAHDDALKAMAKAHPDRATLIESYFRERADAAYHHFPYEALLPDWLVPGAAAAYRAGLRVDLGHPKAYAGLTRGLSARVDHPHARAVLIVAAQTLAPDDDRLEHVIPALVSCREPDAVAAVREAAWRWVEAAAGIDKVLAKRAKNNTLNDVFAKDDLLLPAVCAVLEPCDEESEKLALGITAKSLSFRVRGVVAGLQCRVYGKRGHADKLEPMTNLLLTLDVEKGTKETEHQSVRIDLTAAVAYAEASLAIARLDPKGARKVFDKLLACKRFSDARTAAIAACLLPGILWLDREDKAGRLWLERVLGARNGGEHIYGALLAAREAKLDALVPSILPHAYSSQLNELMGQFAYLEQTARKTLEALGHPAPPFDEEDKFAEHVPEHQLGAALVRHDRYDKGGVLERMEKLERPEPFAPALGAFLTDRLRFSKHEDESHITSDDLTKAIELLRQAGAAGKAELATLKKLPELGAWAKELLG